MASITEQPGGRRTIQFVGADGKRRSIRLGKVSQRIADGIKRYVELLNVAKIAKQPLDGETAAWVAGISDWLADKLTRVGLIEPRMRSKLGAFLDDYRAARKDAKEWTRLTLRSAAKRLVSHFVVDRTLESITLADMDRFKIHLEARYSPATASRTIVFARTFFKAAVRARLIATNPADDVRTAGRANIERMHFVDRATVERIMDVADIQWRLIIALARYGGVRVPSELAPLKLTDIDFERGRLRVTSPKTENHGKAERWIPLFPELRPHVETAFETAPDGENWLVRVPQLERTAGCGDNRRLRSGFLALLRKAGVAPWERIFNSMRSSRETELAAEYPTHVACAWLGNTPRVAAKHYLVVRDSDFERALGANKSGAESGAVSARPGMTAEDMPDEKPQETP
jgi:integrase